MKFFIGCYINSLHQNGFHCMHPKFMGCENGHETNENFNFIVICEFFSLEFCVLYSLGEIITDFRVLGIIRQ